MIGIESGKSEFVIFPKHENSTTEGKEGENEKSEGKGKGKFGTCRDPGFKIQIQKKAIYIFAFLVVSSEQLWLSKDNASE